MKRINNTFTSDGSPPKKFKDLRWETGVIITESGICSTLDHVTTPNSIQHEMDVEHNLVEREASPCNYSLDNSSSEGLMPHIEGLDELNEATVNASSLLANNSVHQTDQQMKLLPKSPEAIIQQTERSAMLFQVASNFVKKPGKVYHLYLRPFRKMYFSMLSPKDWGGKPPHEFLSSWYLGYDGHWTPLEEMTNQTQGIMWRKA